MYMNSCILALALQACQQIQLLVSLIIMTDVQQKQKQPLQPRDDVVQLNWQYFEKCTTRAASSSSRWFWQAHYAWVSLLDLKATVWNAPASDQAA